MLLFDVVKLLLMPKGCVIKKGKMLIQFAPALILQALPHVLNGKMFEFYNR